MDPGDLPLGPIVLAIGGIASVASGLILRDRAAESRAWLSVRGRVYAARVIEVQQPATIDDRRYTEYRPEIRYEFTVSGKEYAGNRYSLLATAASWRSYAEGVVMRYPIGSEVDVYYDPTDPNRCVLVRDNVERWARLAMIGGSLTFLGALVWGSMMR